MDRGITPTDEDYGDMITGERPEADDEEKVHKYLNVEIILDVGLENERQGRVDKRSRELEARRLDVHTLTHSLIQGSTTFSSQMDQWIITQQT